MGFQRTYYWTPKIQHGGDPPSWIVMPKCKNAIFSKTTQFRAMVAINDPQEMVNGLVKKTHYWTPKIQDGGDPPSWILTPKCKSAIFSKTKQFRATVSIDNLQEVM